MRPATAIILVTGLLAGGGTIGGCTAAPAWTPVETGAVRVAALATSADGLLVAGSAGNGPALLSWDGTAAHSVALTPQEPYAGQATLVVVSASGPEVDAIGTVVGGAHGNPRWTVWDGTRAGITSRPQEFFTFGGHDAGPLLAVLQTPDGPVVVGSRTTATGARAVLYTRTGTTWSPSPSPEALTSTATTQLGFSAAAAAGGRLLVAGDELLLTAGLDQRPVVEVGNVHGDWQRTELPTAGITGSGLVRATSVACAGASCRVAGWVRGHPVAWTLDADSGAAGAPSVLSGEVPAGNDPRAVVALASGLTVVATNAADPTIQVECPGGWKVLPSPGAVTGLETLAGVLYAVSDARLWRLDTPRC